MREIGSRMEPAVLPNGFLAGHNSNIKKCVKCSKEANVSVTSKIAYCEECFLPTVRGKFRSALSKKGAFKDREKKVLVLLDGSKESAFLFRMVEDALKQTNFKRLMIEPSFVVFLSSMETPTINLLEERISILRQVLPCTYYIVHLAAVFGDIDIADDGNCHGLQYLPKLEEFCKAFRQTASREEATRILKIRLLQKLSRHTGISKVMMSCNSDELAQITITQLCYGRGGCVSKMTDIVEKTPSGTTFIRPLRDVSSLEIAAALRLENIENYAIFPESSSRNVESPSSFHVWEAPEKGSIQKRSSAFLEHFVDEGFESTFPTVLGISRKVHVPAGSSRCSICEYPFSGSSNLCYACSSIITGISPEIVSYLFVP